MTYMFIVRNMKQLLSSRIFSLVLSSECGKTHSLLNNIQATPQGYQGYAFPAVLSVYNERIVIDLFTSEEFSCQFSLFKGITRIIRKNLLNSIKHNIYLRTGICSDFCCLCVQR